MNGAEPTCQQQRRLLLKQVGLEMTLEGAQESGVLRSAGRLFHVRGPFTVKLS